MTSTALAPTPQQPRTAPSRRWLALAVAVALLAATTVLANRVLPGWAYPLCGVVAVVGLLGLARWSKLHPSAIGLDRRHLRRAAIVGLIGLGLVAAAFGTALAIPALRTVFHDGRVGS